MPPNFSAQAFDQLLTSRHDFQHDLDKAYLRQQYLGTSTHYQELFRNHAYTSSLAELTATTKIKMPSSSKNESPKPTLTQKQMDLLSCVMANLKSQPEIDVSL